jgi:hypothetical protein
MNRDAAEQRRSRLLGILNECALASALQRVATLIVTARWAELEEMERGKPAAV